MSNRKYDPHLDDDPCYAHAPAGYTPFMQFFRGESREQALRVAAKVAGTKDLAIAPGHFALRDEADVDSEWVFQPFGWMTFVPEPWTRKG